MKVFFIRHAEGYHNLSLSGEDIKFPKLTEKGIIQAKNCSSSFTNQNIDAIIVSPLNRTLHTAELIFGKKDFLISELIREYVGHNCDFRESKEE